MAKDDKYDKLSQEEISRYSRHLILPEVGLEGQLKLKNAKVLVVGTGGLGAPVILYLAAAGVGTIGLIDFDIVDESNLQRQIIHTTKDIGRPKISSATDRIKAINPNVKVVAHNDKLTSQNAINIIKDFDIVVDGTDNFQTRYLVNDSCVILKKPFVYGSIFRFEGQASVFNAYDGPCYRCLYPEPPPVGLVPSCAEGGVIGVLPGVIGTIQANETIKLILGVGEVLKGRLLAFDGLKMQFKELKLKKDEKCPVCSEHPVITELIDYEEFCGLKKPDERIEVEEISAIDLKNLINEKRPVQLIDIRQPHELQIGKIEGSKGIPFGQLLRRKDELDSSKKAVIICKIGLMSAEIIRQLKQSGYTGEIYSLKGGITSWANDIDYTMARY
ncbi:molybdopterin-synthase adenylyltransferase MoeB [Aliarcobacter butzleri]|jgi:adenylyltransferase/sulfurtransferase|uniref:molybdopterin-synthase adenylyltransferase MoeB n=1 Tax=Aliarcobacter butzleri TaxID=28197 RepID=UPI0021B2B30C|nr:molybdopterin-synthase adenylyltransferase MoeB [Aliarcobacter butzleri]MCT7586790.1 molybdopterin-synthase adenylyltransferase MoeB [Aliarcobacter butzleri]